MPWLESISKAREARWKKRNVCTRSTDATDQDVEGTCSTTASKDQYLLQSQVQESTPAGIVKTILLQVQMETETVLFSFLREMHSCMIPNNDFCMCDLVYDSFKNHQR